MDKPSGAKVTSSTKTLLNSVGAVNDTENISDAKSFHQFGGEMKLVLATLSEAVENLIKRPKNDPVDILEWLEDWDWVAESDPGKAWSFDWCVEVLGMTRANYDPDKARRQVQEKAFSYDRVCAMRDQAMRGLARKRGAVL